MTASDSASGPSDPGIRYEPTALNLSEILGRGTNVLHRPRPVAPPWISELRAEVAGLSTFETKVRFESPSATHARRLVEPLPATSARDALEADVAGLLGAYGALVRGRRLQAALMLTDRVTCPKFHADHVGLRLLCAYVGPGTEWVPEAHVDRTHLCCADHGPEEANRLIVPDPARIVRARTFDVLVLKGDAFPGNAGRGAVHRTPPDAAAGGKRLVLKIDDIAAMAGGG